MQDLKALAEEILRQHLINVLQDVVATELMDEDPECQLLTDDDWDRVADFIADADVDIRVRIH